MPQLKSQDDAGVADDADDDFFGVMQTTHSPMPAEMVAVRKADRRSVRGGENGDENDGRRRRRRESQQSGAEFIEQQFLGSDQRWLSRDAEDGEIETDSAWREPDSFIEAQYFSKSTERRNHGMPVDDASRERDPRTAIPSSTRSSFCPPTGAESPLQPHKQRSQRTEKERRATLPVPDHRVQEQAAIETESIFSSRRQQSALRTAKGALDEHGTTVDEPESGPRGRGAIHPRGRSTTATSRFRGSPRSPGIMGYSQSLSSFSRSSRDAEEFDEDGGDYAAGANTMRSVRSRKSQSERVLSVGASEARIRASPRAIAETPLEVFEELERARETQMAAANVAGENGLKEIMQLITPVWKLSNEKLVDLMTKRVIFNDDCLLAFDKPYGMAYSGAPSDQAQLDRILQKLKSRLSPSSDRLHLVKSLDKHVTGVILFAKNASVQKELVKLYEEARVEQRFRCLVRGKPREPEARVNFPLQKIERDRDIKMIPVVEERPAKNPHFVETHYREMNNHASCSLLECTVFNDVTHQVRSHLAYGIGCGIIGDPKYGIFGERGAIRPIPVPTQHALSINANQSRKLPLYLHLNKVLIPSFAHYRKPVTIVAPLPNFFEFTLKKLKLLKK